jgi:hypothetical protein
VPGEHLSLPILGHLIEVKPGFNIFLSSKNKNFIASLSQGLLSSSIRKVQPTVDI